MGIDKDGWINWCGGEEPPAGVIEKVKLRDGYITHWAGAMRWTHLDRNSDIVAYKLAEPAAPTLAGDSTQATTFFPLPVLDVMSDECGAARAEAAKPTPKANPKDAIGDKKLPSHLVSPIVKAYQAIASFLGNIKYGAWNFRVGGVRSSVYYSALNRHADAWWEGEELDPADGTPHLANALACLGILIEAQHSKTLIDDRPPSRSTELARIRLDFEQLMEKIREQHKDKNPRHFTINDTNLTL